MKKHSPGEILAKLGHANELEQRGLTQAEICQDLGVSVMTFHRWRKLPLRQFDAHRARAAAKSTPSDDLKRVHELQLENQQLRKIIADLMLEKLRIEEAAAKSHLAEDRPPERQTI